MSIEWQTWAALLVVLGTAAIMAYRIFSKKKSGCVSDCGCAGGDLKKKAGTINKGHPSP
jgi:hypothetical protein